MLRYIRPCIRSRELSYPVSFLSSLPLVSSSSSSTTAVSTTAENIRKRSTAVLFSTTPSASSSTSSSSSASTPPLSRVGVVFDIDGVVLRGYNMLPHARESLLRLIEHRIPFIFLTNGGGELESIKQEKLSKILGLPIHNHQIILSHTPLKPICKQYAHQRVLVLGCRDVLGVGRSYGLQRMVTVKQLCEDEPYRYPFIHYEKNPLPQHDPKDPISAIFILHDPNDWAPEIQVSLDVLRGGYPLGSGKCAINGTITPLTHQAVPIYSSNPDLLFAGLYPVPRLAAGSYTVALKAMWKAVTGGDLQVTQYGKPMKVTFDFAKQRLGVWAKQATVNQWHQNALVYAQTNLPNAEGGGSWAKPVASRPEDIVTSSSATDETEISSSSPSSIHQFDKIFMVGDNPQADIKGANDSGEPWHSILVRTGVFQGKEGTNDPRNPGRTVVQGIQQAVDLVIDTQRKLQ